MKKQKVISFKNLPYKMPWTTTAVIWLLADKFQATDFVWGIIWVFIVLLWSAWIYGMFTTESVEIL